MRTLSVLILLISTSACRGWNGIGNVNDSGTQSKFDTVTLETPEEWGENCTFGGVRVDTGFDNGDGEESANDGILGAGEVDKTEYICSTGPQPLVHLRLNNSLANAGSLGGVGTGSHGGYDLDACGSLVHAALFSDHAVLTPVANLQAGQASLSVWFRTPDSTGYNALMAQPDPVLPSGLIQMGLADGAALVEYFSPASGTSAPHDGHRVHPLGRRRRLASIGDHRGLTNERACRISGWRRNGHGGH